MSTRSDLAGRDSERTLALRVSTPFGGATGQTHDTSVFLNVRPCPGQDPTGQ